MAGMINKQGVRGAIIVHGVVLLLLLALSWRPLFCRRDPPLVIPVEFMVAVEPAEPSESVPAEAPLPAVPEPEPEPTPEPEPEPTPEPEPPPRPARPPIQVSRERVVRRTSPPAAPEPPRLTPEEIQQLLDQGARPGTRTTVPDEDQRGMIQVRNALHAAWRQPTAADAGSGRVVVEVALSAAGAVSSPRIIRSSGSAVMDESVLQAVAAVPRIPGLPAGFLQRYPRLRVEFRLQT